MITENAYVKSTWKFDGYYITTIVKKQKKNKCKFPIDRYENSLS